MARRHLAAAAGARVIEVANKGYGAALMGGIEAANGRYVIMADADDSYDFTDLDGFVERLRRGFKLVIGNRFQGGIKPGAMPLLNRYLGNPVLSLIGRTLFASPVGDFHCGLRGFERQAILGLNLRAPGMEFASEMVVKASLASLEIAEVPTTLSPDGRQRAPHLRPWRDGWRHLRFMLLRSPQWLFLYPGLLIAVLGLVSSAMLVKRTYSDSRDLHPRHQRPALLFDCGYRRRADYIFRAYSQWRSRERCICELHTVFPERLLNAASSERGNRNRRLPYSRRNRRRDICGSAVGTFILRSSDTKRNDANHHPDCDGIGDRHADSIWRILARFYRNRMKRLTWTQNDDSRMVQRARSRRNRHRFSRRICAADGLGGRAKFIATDGPESMEQLLRRADSEVRPLQLNFYKKAKFANSFKWRLIENGVARETADDGHSDIGGASFAESEFRVK